MSWRVLIVFLVLAAVASWQGGLELGKWLVSRAPDTVASVADKDYKALGLDANGRPLTVQPPQPRIDGTLGVPRELQPIDWTIEAVTADNFELDPNAMKIDDEDDDDQSSEGSEAADARREQARAKLPRPPSDFGFVENERPPAAQSAAAPPVPPGITVTTISWTQLLKRDLDQCSKVGFFQRPTCVQTARNKYCAPNNAWGKTPDCPPKPMDQITGG